ncbi:Fibrillin-1, partial [Geodia barretti]
GSRVVRPSSRVGVRVHYITIPSPAYNCSYDNGGCDHICNDSSGIIECQCQHGYDLIRGSSCIDRNECESGSHSCDQVCTNTEGSYTCSCHRGLELGSDGETCIDINECSVENGGCDHECINRDGSFECRCRSGYQLTNERECIDIDECLEGTHNCDQVCTNTEGSYTCYCRSGFEFGSDGESCIDINECLVDNGSCDHECLNQVGSFECRCRNGYRLANGGECVDMNECSEGTHNCDGDCTNTDGSYTCSCNDGLLLQPDGHSCRCGGLLTAASGSFHTEGWPRAYRPGNFQCEWIIQLPNNDATVQFTMNHTAFGINGNPSASCPTDYIQFFDGTSSNSNSLEKICGVHSHYGGTLPVISTTSSSARVVFTGSNLRRPLSRVGVKVDYVSIVPIVYNCSVENGGCHHICVSRSEGVECQCRDGYGLIGRSTCSDRNECESGSHGCDQVCTNAEGSYTCSCHSGLELGSDGESCIDINECSVENGGCNYECVNQEGSFECRCRDGYRVSNGRECIEIDECSEGTHNCDSDCTNTDGSYTCSCNNGLLLQPDGHSCRCGGILTAASGSFQTDGWPTSYRQENFQCEWIIQLPNSDATIQFNIDQSAFGTLGKPPCNKDYIQFFDGTDSGAASLKKICGLLKFYGGAIPSINTTSSTTRVVFTGTRFQQRPLSRVGVKVDYVTIPPPDVDECALGTHNCEQLCENTPGSFICSCRNGYSLSSDDRTCNDIDECLGNSHGCDQVCTNTNGSYACSCVDRFTLQSDMQTCISDPTPPPELSTTHPKVVTPSTSVTNISPSGTETITPTTQSVSEIKSTLTELLVTETTVTATSPLLAGTPTPLLPKTPTNISLAPTVLSKPAPTSTELLVTKTTVTASSPLLAGTPTPLLPKTPTNISL